MSTGNVTSLTVLTLSFRDHASYLKKHWRNDKNIRNYLARAMRKLASNWDGVIESVEYAEELAQLGHDLRDADNHRDYFRFFARSVERLAKTSKPPVRVVIKWPIEAKLIMRKDPDYDGDALKPGHAAWVLGPEDWEKQIRLPPNLLINQLWGKHVPEHRGELTVLEDKEVKYRTFSIPDGVDPEELESFVRAVEIEVRPA